MSFRCEISSLSTPELVGHSCHSQCLEATWPVGRMASMPLKGVRWEMGSRKLCRSWWVSPSIFSPGPATGRKPGLSSCPAAVFTWPPAGFGLSHNTECLLLCGQKWHQWNTAPGEFCLHGLSHAPSWFLLPSMVSSRKEFWIQGRQWLYQARWVWGLALQFCTGLSQTAECQGRLWVAPQTWAPESATLAGTSAGGGPGLPTAQFLGL